jgi:mannose-6-phosphate isomerase-like protein (cupin superfamily)
MIKILSKINNEILHIYIKKDFTKKREDIISEDNFLQLATLSLDKDQTFKPHQHIFKDVNYKKTIAQESWVVMEGSVRVDYYDIDGSFLISHVLYKGDCTVTLKGGHNYTSLEKNTYIYEFKSGPYEGIEKDKVFI